MLCRVVWWEDKNMAEANPVVPPFHPSSEDNTYRILLVGKTGSGKSATGNTLLGVEKFKTKMGLASETYECQLERTENTSFSIEVMDCPGLFDTKTPNRVIIELILKAVGGMHPGPNAIVYVMKVGDRYTEEEYRTFKRLKEVFGPEVVHYMIVAFTHGDQLAVKKITIDDYVRDGIAQNKLIQNVLGQCAYRYVEFNNTPTGPKGQQVEILLTKINDMVRGYRHRTFKSAKFEIVTIEIEGEVRRRLKADRENRIQEQVKDATPSPTQGEPGQSQSEMTKSAAGQQHGSVDTLPLLDAAYTKAGGSSAADNSQLQTAESDTSRQDSDKPLDVTIPEKDIELADRYRFQLRLEITQGSGFFSRLEGVISDIKLVTTCIFTGVGVGILQGPAGMAVGAVIGGTVGGAIVGTKYAREWNRLKAHFTFLRNTWEERWRVTTAGDSAQNTESAA